MTYIYIPFDPPAPTAVPCPTCQGYGITGDRYGMEVDAGTLLIDVFCPSCMGCGNGDPEHHDCEPRAHADYDPGAEYADYGDDGAYDDDEQPSTCPSCQGRGWNAVQSFVSLDNTTDWGQDAPTTMTGAQEKETVPGSPYDEKVVYTRQPCGCTEARAQFLAELPTGQPTL